jgi:hypothetical protein
VSPRHVHHDPLGAESDASHERTLQTEQLVEYRGDAHRILRGFDFSQSTKYHGFPVRFSPTSSSPAAASMYTMRAQRDPLDV